MKVRRIRSSRDSSVLNYLAIRDVNNRCKSIDSRISEKAFLFHRDSQSNIEIELNRTQQSFVSFDGEDAFNGISFKFNKLKA